MAPSSLSALVTCNLLLCFVEAASTGGGSVHEEFDLSAVEKAGGVHKKGKQVQFSIEEHEHGDTGEAEDETNDEGVAYVEVTDSGELKMMATPRPRHSAFVKISNFTEEREEKKKHRQE